MLGDVSLWEIKQVTKDPMRAQNMLLRKILRRSRASEYGRAYDFRSIRTIDDYRKAVPLTRYEDYAPYIERMMQGERNLLYSGRNVRYCTSSGSVGKPKMLPKSVNDLWKMQCIGFSCSVATAAHWLRRTKGIRMPKQIGLLTMALTGHTAKDGKRINDAGQVPLDYLRCILPLFCTSPLSLMYPQHEQLLDVAYLQLRFALVNRNVSYLGSLVITLLTTMFDYLERNWEMLCRDVEKGVIDPSVRITPELRKEYEKKLRPDPERAAQLRREFAKGFDDPIAPRIWPRLTWVYGMVSSTLKVYVKKLRRYIGPDIPLHNMGYGAAEGFFAMATELDVNDYVLLPHCVFFEFIPVDGDEDDADAQQTDEPKTLLLSELEAGKKYEVVISTFSGLYRYRMFDVVQVTRMYQNTPQIEFLYRRNLGMNIANEKMTTDMVDEAVSTTTDALGLTLAGYSFFDDFSTDPPRYGMVCEPLEPVDETVRKKMIALLDERFREYNDKYAIRRMSMIGAPEVLFLQKGSYAAYRESVLRSGRVLNQVKPVTVLNTPQRREFFLSRVVTPSTAVEKMNAPE
jgi:hypothetical protein